ncbi:MAG: peptidase [Acidobacteriota bacterium]|nr:peptidase [Acidobacteriota bacterium]
MNLRRTLLLAFTFVAAVQAMAGTGRIIIVNNDRPGVGFNDPRAATPVGGNDGTTLGQQRLNVFNAAAATWSKLLDLKVDIVANATFSSIDGCTETEAVLGQASPMTWQRDFTNAPMAKVWYPIALANNLAGKDLNGSGPEIFVQFNSDIDLDNCLGKSSWYYGLDAQHGDDTDLYVVVLHELAHGLGVSGTVRAPGFRDNLPAITDIHTFDTKAGTRWDQMTDAQRQVSLTNTGNLVWDGDNVRSKIGQYLEPVTMLTITEPSPVARNYDIGTAAFGPAANASAFAGRVVRATDASNTDGASTFDGCTAFTNAGAIKGNVAYIDRGNCTFVAKSRNAQAAGATAVIIADNKRETCQPPGMGGEAEDITIPVISIGTTDAESIVPQLAGSTEVRGMLRKDGSQLAGTSTQGYVRLYAPCTSSPGSSTHHFDIVASPNLLMEPSINSDLSHGVDLTLYQLLDLGWTVPAKSGRPFLKRQK